MRLNVHLNATECLTCARPRVAYCTEGVLQAEKDFNLKEHPEIAGVPNLQVIKLMQSFKSKELVTERFSWRHYYWWVRGGEGLARAGSCRHSPKRSL